MMNMRKFAVFGAVMAGDLLPMVYKHIGKKTLMETGA